MMAKFITTKKHLDDGGSVEVDLVKVFQHWNVARLHFLVALVALKG